MMSTSELQLDLINKIANITDEIKLREILLLLQFQTDDSVFETSEEDKKAIAEAREQVANGHTLTNQEVQIEIHECLKK